MVGPAEKKRRKAKWSLFCSAAAAATARCYGRRMEVSILVQIHLIFYFVKKRVSFSFHHQWFLTLLLNMIRISSKCETPKISSSPSSKPGMSSEPLVINMSLGKESCPRWEYLYTNILAAALVFSALFSSFSEEEEKFAFEEFCFSIRYHGWTNIASLMICENFLAQLAWAQSTLIEREPWRPSPLSKSYSRRINWPANGVFLVSSVFFGKVIHTKKNIAAE